MSRPPLGLTVNITGPDGAVTRWASNDPDPQNRPRGLSFDTQRMQGFGAGAVNLARRIDRDYIDTHLYDDVAIVGDDGSTAYEGRVGAAPRSMDDRHTVSLHLAGWIAHAADRTFSQVFVDRDLSRWHGPSVTRRANLLAGGFGQIAEPAVVADQAGSAALRTAFTGAWVAGKLPLSEAWYDAGAGNLIKYLSYEWTRGVNVPVGPDTWFWAALLSTDDVATTVDGGADLQAAGPGSGTLTSTGAKRYAAVNLFNQSAPGGADGTEYNVDWRNLAVYGDHGITGIGSNPQGLAASDIIKWVIGHYCPLLNTTGVQQTTYAIPHLVVDRATPYDAVLMVNAYHLWDIAVWEGRTLHYAPPADLSDYDWEVRLDDPGTTVTLQGDSTESLANGIVVKYTDVATGLPNTLTPDTTPELRDTNPSNPVNQHGLQVWTDFDLSFPTTAGAATQLGRIALAEFNQPKAPGSITAGPYLRDRAGHWQQAWKVRAGDRVAITSSTSLSDRPRPINQTSYDHDNLRVTMAVDSTHKTLPAIIDRITTALAAANLNQ